jgi:peptidyl-prolyl cis-trans isomerase B (cyclophilin B)
MMEAEAEVEKEAEMRAEPFPVVRINTRKGAVEVELFEDDAPHAVVNFVNLVNEKYYDGLRFAPVIGSAIARSGDPRSRDGRRDGPDGPPWKVKLDRSARQPLLGRLVALVSEGGVAHGSQFGILLAPVIGGSGDVVVFGRVTKGMDVLQTLEDGDVLTKAEVVRKRNHSYGALASRVK